MPGAHTRGREQPHMSEWRGDQPQVRPQCALSFFPVSAFLRHAQGRACIYACTREIRAGLRVAEKICGY